MSHTRPGAKEASPGLYRCRRRAGPGGKAGEGRSRHPISAPHGRKPPESPVLSTEQLLSHSFLQMHRRACSLLPPDPDKAL